MGLAARLQRELDGYRPLAAACVLLASAIGLIPAGILVAGLRDGTGMTETQTSVVGFAVGGAMAFLLLCLFCWLRALTRAVVGAVRVALPFAAVAVFLLVCYGIGSLAGYGLGALAHLGRSGGGQPTALDAESPQYPAEQYPAQQASTPSPNGPTSGSADDLWAYAEGLEANAQQSMVARDAAVKAWEATAYAMQQEGRTDGQLQALQHKDDCINAYASTAGGADSGSQPQAGGASGEAARIQGHVDAENEWARQFDKRYQRTQDPADQQEAGKHRQNAADFQSGARNPFGYALMPGSDAADTPADIRGWVNPGTEEAARTQQ